MRSTMSFSRPSLLNALARSHGVLADALVQVLTVAAALTASIMMFSVAIKGNSRRKCCSITFGYTTRPSATFVVQIQDTVHRQESSGDAERLFAESSNVRSNHWVDATIIGFITSAIT